MLKLKKNGKRIVKYYLILLLLLAVKFIFRGGRGSLSTEFNSIDDLFFVLPYLALFTIPLVVYFFYVDKKEKEYKESHPRDETKVWDITKEIIEEDKHKESLNKESENSKEN